MNEEEEICNGAKTRIREPQIGSATMCPDSSITVAKCEWAPNSCIPNSEIDSSESMLFFSVWHKKFFEKRKEPCLLHNP